MLELLLGAALIALGYSLWIAYKIQPLKHKMYSALAGAHIRLAREPRDIHNLIDVFWSEIVAAYAKKHSPDHIATVIICCSLAAYQVTGRLVDIDFSEKHDPALMSLMKKTIRNSLGLPTSKTE